MTWLKMFTKGFRKSKSCPESGRIVKNFILDHMCRTPLFKETRPF